MLKPLVPHADAITIRLHWQAGQIDDVDIVARRPDVTPMLVGRPCDAAVATLPLLFALCGKAQARAATLALAAARGVDTPPQRADDVAAEAVREHLWRLLLDLPPRLGLAARRDLAETALSAVARGERRVVLRLLDDPFWSTLTAHLAALPAVAPIDVLLPTLDADATVSPWPTLDARLARWPTWHDAPAETGAYARAGGRNPTQAGALAARWLARCAEVWAWAHDDGDIGALGQVSAVPVASHVGRAAVHTARGVLMHEIALDGDVIAGYTIVAPTEWNFHPAGVLADWLISADASDANVACRLAEHAVAALDPCVAWRVEMMEALVP